MIAVFMAATAYAGKTKPYITKRQLPTIFILRIRIVPLNVVVLNKVEQSTIAEANIPINSN